MTARHTDSRLLRAVGAGVFAVAVVGGVAFGWDFSGSTGTIPAAIAVAAAAVATAVGYLSRSG
ncbi:hypothetical protein GRX03_09060 [Halovenus sp. WSH3]|uniref:Uncharacterized protein n=1 Tax=Halovenus carboxidivorans TaxID=2692199 RepID=A0A6B0T931_9EURY|nr:hypothetical protein [Halovenus carboxidivorans]MXR51751.1 hypothetical protein [Halovenus carboxidivorans]